MSWDHDVLDVSPVAFQDALRHSPQHKSLAGLQAAPPPPQSPSKSPQPPAAASLTRSETAMRQQHRSSAVLSSSGSNSVVSFASPLPPHSSSTMSFQESMDEVERLLDENVRQRYYDRHEKSAEEIAELQLQARAKRESHGKPPSPTKRTFEFTPLRDPFMLVATATQDAEDEREAAGAESSTGDSLLRSSRNGDDDDTENDDDPDVGITAEVKLKYFGADAKSAYYKTYQELHGKSHLFVERQTSHSLASAASAHGQRRLGAASRPNSLGTPVSPFRNKPGVLSAILATTNGSNCGLLDQETGSLAETPASQDVDSPTPCASSPTTRRRQALQFPTLAMGSGALLQLESSPSLHSPRVLFLSSCIAQSHPALAIVIRKDKCRAFDFRHQGLGDAFMVQFAACLPDLPLVEAINVSGNRLSDRALNCLLLALENKPNLTALDISENEVGATSAASLRNYIASSLCTLKTLALNNADVDDHECTLFMIAFEQNKSVEHLFLHSNRIGHAVAVRPAGKDALATTGGDAIGAMLTVNLNIATLDLSWNRLKVATASPIAHALELNYNLRELTLAYNACGDEGAMVFGHALRVNTALAKLDLRYNSIGARGALVLASGLAANKGLSALVLDGNAIGLESGRALMHVACASRGGHATCHLSLFECNLTPSVGGESGTVGGFGRRSTKAMTLFNAADPTGAYTLDLTDPYENMIAHELLRLATFKPPFQFVKLEYASSKGGASTPVELSRRGTTKKPTTGGGGSAAAASEPSSRSPVARLFAQIDKDGSGSVDLAELALALHEYGLRISDERLSLLVNEYDYDHSGSLQEAEFHDLFVRCGFAMVDTDESGSLNADEIATVLRFMGVPDISPSKITRMIARYDLDGSGEIDESEFLEFMKAEASESDEQQAAERSDADETTADEAYESVALREASGAIWKIPTTGTLSLEFDKRHDLQHTVDDDDRAPASRRRSSALSSPSPSVSDAVVAKLVSSVQGVSRNSTEQGEFLKAVLADSDLFFTASQAEHVLDQQGELKSASRKLAALVRILPQMVNRREAIALTGRLYGDPRKQWHERFLLRRQLGNMYPVLLGSLTSRCAFDLGSADDRAALKKLALLAQDEKLFSKNRSGRSDTSQHGNWENFRHATIDGKMVLLTSTYILNALLAPASAPKASPAESKRVEFCYVSTTRPPRGTKVLTSRRFEQLVRVLTEPITDGHGPLHSKPNNAVRTSDGPDNALEKSRENARIRWQLVRNSISGFHGLSKRSDPSHPDLFRVQCTVDSVQQKLFQLEMLVCDRWLRSDQAGELVAAFPNVLCARAHAACIVFNRVVDIENFLHIYDALSSEDQEECVHRLGWLNMFDPTQPDRQFPPLDLSTHDERELVQILAQLAANEGQATWQDPVYYMATTGLSGQLGPPTTLLPSDGLPPAGWGNADATGEQSLKHHGLVRVRFQSISQDPTQEEDDEQATGAGSSRSSRAMHVDAETHEFRRQLRLKVLCGTRLFL